MVCGIDISGESNAQEVKVALREEGGEFSRNEVGKGGESSTSFLLFFSLFFFAVLKFRLLLLLILGGEKGEGDRKQDGRR